MINISVIIPVYNAESTIIESVNSVICELENNPYKWELILIDDGSVDDSVFKIERYIATHSFYDIIFIKQKNGGASSARNAGLKVAKGEYIAFNDADDRWLPNKLNVQLSYLMSHPDVDMIGGKYGNDNLEIIQHIGYEKKITIEDQIFKNYFSPPTVIFRKSILQKVGLFNLQQRFAEEGYFFNNMVFYGKCILLNTAVAESITNKGRWGDCGLSGHLLEMEKGELYNIKEAYKRRYIGIFCFISGYLFSLMKFVRRLVLKYIV